jgi:hypothetical protein
MNNIWWDGRRAGVFGSSMSWLTANWPPSSERSRAEAWLTT